MTARQAGSGSSRRPTGGALARLGHAELAEVLTEARDPGPGPGRNNAPVVLLRASGLTRTVSSS